MKKSTILRKLSFFAVAGLFALTSCDKQDIEPDNTELEAEAILVANATTSSEALFLVNTVPSGSSKDSTTAAQLPAAISTYLNANYSGYTYIKTFSVKKSGTVEGYIVAIKFNDKPVGLKFDATGNFVKVFEQRERGQLKGKGWKKGGRFDGRDGQHRDTIALSALSTLVKAYFTLNYPQDTLLAAHTGKGGDIVVISANNGLHATLFTSGSLFLKRAPLVLQAGKKTTISQAELPAKIATYLTTTYPAYVFHRAYAVKINSTIQAYLAFIDANDTKYALHFDASGNLVKSVVVK
jgi:hypothetical protein